MLLVLFWHFDMRDRTSPSGHSESNIGLYTDLLKECVQFLLYHIEDLVPFISLCLQMRKQRLKS